MARPTEKSKTAAAKKTAPARAAAKKPVAKKAAAKKAPVKSAAKKGVSAAKPAAKKAAAPAAAKKTAAPAKKPAAKKAAAPAKQAKPVAAAPAPAPAPAKKAVAKAAPAKAAPAPPKPKTKPPKFSPKELDAIRQDLLDHRSTYEKEFEDLESGSLNVSQSDMSGEVSYDEEFADAGTFTFERERDLSLSNNIKDLMDKVDSAMRKLDEGTYGVCERCGNAIDKARLQALPYSVLCITCKQLEERIR